jgi:hypothetical protein
MNHLVATLQQHYPLLPYFDDELLFPLSSWPFLLSLIALLGRRLPSSAWHFIRLIWPKPQPAEFSGRNWAAAGRRPITVAGRTRPRSRHTWPHPFVSTRLL